MDAAMGFTWLNEGREAKPDPVEAGPVEKAPMGFTWIDEGRKGYDTPLPKEHRRIQFDAGDLFGNLQRIMKKVESPDYVTLTGGAKDNNILKRTVHANGLLYGNKAMGAYQIQRDTAVDMLQRNGIDPRTFIFDQSGQDRIFHMLLEDAGLKKYKAGLMSKAEFAHKLSRRWAGLPKDASNRSYHAGVGNNKAHITWEEFMTALD